MSTEFSFANDDTLTDNMKRVFIEDGYVIVKSVLSSSELSKLRRVIEMKGGVKEHAFELNDGDGLKSKMALWNHPGNDVTGMLLDGEVYHYHSKLIMKEAKTGGQFVWHQDYGYWYKNGCLFPNMASVMIAIDKCERSNGCLQVIKGSHKLGRIDHVMVGGQTGADTGRVEQIKKYLPMVYASLDPGDAIFFHCNVLHRSDQNLSDNRRWVFICSYNRADNNPVTEHHHPQYTPLQKVPNEAILKCTNTDLNGKWFMDPSNDKTIRFREDEQSMNDSK